MIRSMYVNRSHDVTLSVLEVRFVVGIVKPRTPLSWEIEFFCPCGLELHYFWELGFFVLGVSDSSLRIQTLLSSEFGLFCQGLGSFVLITWTLLSSFRIFLKTTPRFYFIVYTHTFI